MRRFAFPITLTVIVFAANTEHEVRRRPASAGPRFLVIEPAEPSPAVRPETSPDAEPGAILPTLPGSRLRGVVVDPEGSGVAGVVVHAEFGHITTCCGGGDRCGQAEATTDSKGGFAFEAPDEAGWAVVTVDAPGWVEAEPREASCLFGTSLIRVPRSEAWHATAVPGPWPKIPADARALSSPTFDGLWPGVKIILERGASVEGVVETDVGEIVPGALVSAFWRDDLPGWRTSKARADERGWFSILVPAPAYLKASAVRTVEEREAADAPQAWAGPVLPGASGLRLVMRPLAMSDLRVTGPSGPIELATVRLKSVGPSATWWPITWWTAEGGEVRGTTLAGLAPGTYDIWVDPSDGDCLPAFATVSVPGGPVEIRCPPAARIEGLLEDGDAQGYEITWTGPGDDMRRTVWTENGRFLLQVGDGAGEVYARREGDPRCAFVARYCPAQGLLRLALAEGQSIRGRVEGRPGFDLSALSVRAVAGFLTQEAKVNGDGTFAIVGLPPLAFRVELRSDGWLHDARDDVPAGADGVRLRVRLPATEPEDDGS